MDELLDMQVKRDFCDYEDCVWMEDLCASFQSMRQAQELTDLKLCVGSSEFPCHRMLLAASSPYFKAMFTGPMKLDELHGEVQLRDMNSLIVEQLLDYMYTGRLRITVENVQELLISANFLLLSRLVGACCDFLRRQLDCHNCFEMCTFAEVHGCAELQKAAQRFIVKNFMTVTSSDFFEASFEQLTTVLGHDNLQVPSEGDVYQKIISWVSYDSGERKRYLCDLLRLVRLPYLSNKVLETLLLEPVVASCAKSIDLINTAKQCKANIVPRLAEWRNPRRSTNQAEVLVVLGGVQASQVGNSSSSLQHFCCEPDAAFLSWTKQSVMPYVLRNTVMYDVAQFRNAIYVTGGFDGEQGTLNQAWRYQVELEEQSEAWQRVASLSVARYQHGSAVVSGRLFVIGGYNGQHTLANVECYSPDMDEWTVCPPMPECVTFPAAVGRRERLFVIGGMRADSCAFPWMQCFDLPTQTWSVVKTLELNTKGSKSVILNDTIYIVGGPTRDVHVYDPENDVAFDVAPTHDFHVCGGVTVNNGKIYIGGGDNLKDRRNWDSIESYDPATNTWTTVGSLPLPLYWHGLVSIVRNIHQLRPPDLPSYCSVGPSVAFSGFEERPPEYDPR